MKRSTLHQSSMKWGGCVGILLLAVGYAPAQHDLTPPRYAVRDLGLLAVDAIATAPGARAHGINDVGDVVGISVIDELSEVVLGFQWKQGMRALDPLGGDPHSVAFAINDARQTVGISYTLGSGQPQAVRWENGTATALGSFEARDINENGVVVGLQPTDQTGLSQHAVRWSGGQLADLGTLGGTHSAAYAVNELGDVVGLSMLTEDSATHACLWKAGGPIDLGTLGGAMSRAHDLNELGQIVGAAETAAGDPHPCLFEVDVHGQVLSRTDLGVLGHGFGEALGINSRGEVVGTSDSRAFYRAPFGVLEDLNALIAPNSGWQLAEASAISSRGEIVGFGVKDGLPRAFLLIPFAMKSGSGGAISD